MVGACQQNSGIFLVRGSGPDGRSAGAGSGLGLDADDQITWQAAGLERLGTGRDAGGDRGRDWDKMPATKSHGQVADSERPGTRRDAGEGRG